MTKNDTNRLSRTLEQACQAGVEAASSPEYAKGYENGFQEGVELMALALACKMGWSVGETLDHLPVQADQEKASQRLVQAGIPRT